MKLKYSFYRYKVINLNERAAKRPINKEEEGVCSGAEGPTAHALCRSLARMMPKPSSCLVKYISMVRTERAK